MVDEEKIQKAVETFCKNPYWQKYYDDAPSDACRRKIALDFCRSLFFEPKEREPFEEAEKDFTVDDWKYLLKYCGNNPLYTKYKNKIKELEQEELV